MHRMMDAAKRLVVFMIFGLVLTCCRGLVTKDNFAIENRTSTIKITFSIPDPSGCQKFAHFDDYTVMRHC